MMLMKRFNFMAMGAMLVVFGLTTLSAPVWAEGPRYQIIKSENGTLWRMNTETGEIAMCKAEGARMVCASSGGQIEKSTLSAADLEAAQDERRARKRVETTQTLDKLVDVFERLLDIAAKHQKSVEGGATAPAGKSENQ
jgi:hypothetical protein